MNNEVKSELVECLRGVIPQDDILCHLWNSFSGQNNSPLEWPGLGLIAPSFMVSDKEVLSSESNKNFNRARAHFDHSTAEIIDVRLFKNKKVFKKGPEQFGYVLISQTWRSDTSAELNRDSGSKESIWLSYLRSDFPKTRPLPTKNIFSSSKKAWSPHWHPSIPCPISHIAFALQSEANFPDIQGDCVPGSVDVLGSGVPGFFHCYRRHGPSLVTLCLLERSQNDEAGDLDFFILKDPLNYSVEGKKTFLAFQVNLASVIRLFDPLKSEDSSFGNFLACCLATCYSSNASIVEASLSVLQKFCDKGLSPPSRHLNTLLLQLAELFLTCCLRGCDDISQSIVETCLCFITSFYLQIEFPTIQYMIQTFLMFPKGRNSSKLFQHLLCAAPIRGLPSFEKYASGKISRFIDIFSSLSYGSILMNNFIESSKLLLKNSLEHPFQGDHSTMLPVLLSILTALSIFSVLCPVNDALQLKLLRDDAISYSKLRVQFSKWKHTSKFSVIRSIAKQTLSPSNPQWNVFYDRKLKCSYFLKCWLSECKADIFSVNTIRRLIFPSLIKFCKSSMAVNVGSSFFSHSSEIRNSFSVGLSCFTEAWHNEDLRGYICSDLDIIWNGLCLDIINGTEISDSMSTLANFVLLWREYAGIGQDVEKTHFQMMSMLLKQEVLNMFDGILSSGNDILDAYWCFDLSSLQSTLIGTVTSLCKIIAEFDFTTVAVSQSALDNKRLLLGGISQYDESVLTGDDSTSGRLVSVSDTRHKLLKDVEVVIGTIRSEKERLSFSALLLLVNILQRLADVSLENEETGHPHAIHIHREEATKFLKAGMLSEAITCICSYMESSNTNSSMKDDSRKDPTRISRACIEEISLVFYNALKQNLDPNGCISLFLVSSKSSLDPKDLLSISISLMERIWTENVPASEQSCLFRCLQVIFSHPWLNIPQGFENMHAFLSIFSHFFSSVVCEAMHSGMEVNSVHLPLKRLGFDQLLLLSSTCVVFPRDNEGTVDLQKSFITSLKDTGTKLGVLSSGKKTSVPKAMVNHLSEVVSASSCFERIAVDSDSKAPSFRKLLEEIESGTKIGDGANFNVQRSQKWSACLSKMILRSIWQDVVPIFSKTISVILNNCWKRDESVSTVFLCLDGLLHGSLLSLYANDENALDVWISEIAKVRYSQMHYFSDSDPLAIPSGKFISDQKWIETVKQMAISDKRQAYNQIDFIVLSTKEQIDFNVQQERIHKLQSRFEPPLELADGQRTLIRSDKFIVCEVSGSLSKNMSIFLLSDLIIIAQNSQSSVSLKVSDIFHLSAVFIEEVPEPGISLLLSFQNQEFTCTASSKRRLKSWLQDLHHFITVSRESHREFVQDITSNSHKPLSSNHPAKNCSFCMKSFGLFNRKVCSFILNYDSIHV